MSGAAERAFPLGIPANLRPDMLVEASIERIAEANGLRGMEHWVLSMYAAGLAVEMLLQAFALRGGAPFDARHDLQRWLLKSPHPVQTAISDRATDDWNYLTVVWTNRLRYLSARGLLSYLKSMNLHKVKPKDADPLKANCVRLLASAKAVHERGLVLWRPSAS